MHAYSYINEKYRCVQNNIAESTPPEQFQKAIDKWLNQNKIHNTYTWPTTPGLIHVLVYMLISLDNFDISITAIFKKKNEFNHNFHFITQKCTEDSRKTTTKGKQIHGVRYHHKMKRSDLKKKRIISFLILQYLHQTYTILVHCRSIWVICVWGLETREKARPRRAFFRVSRRIHIFTYMLRQCTCIVFILQF